MSLGASYEKFLVKISHSRLSLYLVSLLIVGSTLVALFFKVNGALGTLYHEEASDRALKNSTVENFGNLDELTVLAYHDKNLFDATTLQKLIELHKKIESISGIDSIYSIYNTPFFEHRVVDGVAETLVDPLLINIPKTQNELALLKKRALAYPLFKKNLLSEDGNTTAFNIVIDAKIPAPRQVEIIEEIRNLYKQSTLQGAFHFTGMHVFMNYATHLITHDFIFYTLILLIVLLAVFSFLFNSIKQGAMAILVVAAPISIFVAALTLFKLPFTVATTAVPAILLALSSAYNIHLLTAKPTDLFETLQANMFAIVTTMVGFSSLAFSPVPTVVSLGLFLTFGLLIIAILNHFFTLSIRSLFFSEVKPGKSLRYLVNFVHLSFKRGSVFVFLISGILLFSSIFIYKMEVDTDFYKYFSSQSEMVRSVDFVNSELAGQYPILISFHTTSKAELLTLFKKLDDFLITQEGVDTTFSTLNSLNAALLSTQTPITPLWWKSDDLLYMVSTLAESADRRFYRYFETSSGSEFLYTVRTHLISSKDFKKLVASIDEFLNREVASSSSSSSLNPISYQIGGTYLSIVKSSDQLAKSALLSALFTLLIITIILHLVLRNALWTFFAFVVNAIPLVAVYGIMGILGESLNFGTTIVASVVLGLSVDDTIHFFSKYRRYRRTESISNAISSVIKKGSIPMIFTSVVIGIGFIVLVGSSFVPIFQLGLYLSITVFLCLFFDLFLLPQLLQSSFNKK